MLVWRSQLCHTHGQNSALIAQATADHLSNLVSELSLSLAKDAGLGVVVPLPCQMTRRAVPQPDKDGCHGMLNILLAALHHPCRYT